MAADAKMTRLGAMIRARFFRTKGGAVIGRLAMTQSLVKSWWLLALCGVLNAIFSVVYLVTQVPDGSLIFRKYAVPGTVVFLGKLALAAAACTIAAGIWRSAQGNHGFWC